MDPPSAGHRTNHEEESELDLDSNSAYRQHPRVVSHGPNDWNHDELQRLQLQRLRVPDRPEQTSQDNASSIVRDAGYSLELSDITEERPPEQTLDLRGLGTQFEQGSGISSTSDQAAPSDRAPNYLDNLIRSKSIPSAAKRGEDRFIPIDQLEAVMQPQNVLNELYAEGITGKFTGNLSLTTDLVCRRGKESRQRLFAILCMVRLPGQITKFINSKIFDHDLPFTFDGTLVYRKTDLNSSVSQECLEFFQSEPWEPHHCDAFKILQGRVSAPRFRMSWTANDKILHYPLNSQLILPFMRVEDHSAKDDIGATTKMEGGTSIVRKVKIHPAHYNARPSSTIRQTGVSDSSPKRSDTYFAVKTLNVDNNTDHPGKNRTDSEALALKRFNDKSDRHLIRLLLTFTYNDRFHMVFPWADGNLKDLWEKSSPTMHHHQDPSHVRWMSAQILGLTQALDIIHYCEVDKDNIQGLSPEAALKPHGRHGDLKPENILWFIEEKTSSASMGTLKIADFGFADFHSEHSRSNVHKSQVYGYTQTYQAPEYELEERVSPQYDIWSFGCILLQFVVWYLRGWEGVDDFSKARKDDSAETLIPSDLFFSREYNSPRGGARVKTSVTDIFEELAQDCSKYLLDLLECIQKDLLRVENAKRARIKKIVEKFKVLNESCQQDAMYCTSKISQRSEKNISNDHPKPMEVAAFTLSSVGTLPQQRPASGPSHNEILRGKEQQSIVKVMEGNESDSRSLLSTRTPTATNQLLHKSSECLEHETILVEDEPTFQVPEAESLSLTNGMIESPPIAVKATTSSLQAPFQTPNVVELSDHQTKTQSQPVEQVPELLKQNFVANTQGRSSLRPDTLPTMSIDQNLHVDLDKSKGSRPRGSSEENHSEDIASPDQPHSGWREHKKNIFNRIVNFLACCFRESRP